MQDLSILYQSIFSDFGGIKRAALYFDKIYIMEEMQLQPYSHGIERTPEGDIAKITEARCIMASAPYGVKKELEVLQREGVVEYLETDLEHGGWQQEVERRFSDIFYETNLDLSNKDPEVLDIYNEVALVRGGDPATMLEDYSTLIGFLARLCYCGMLEHNLPICTDTNLTPFGAS